jgi:protein-S-isoprenylcysteine O-methyltransferase Ste14
MTSASPDTAGVIAPPPLIFLAGLGAGIALDALLPSLSVSAAVRVPIGGALLAGGLALMGSFVRAFARSQTAVRPDAPTTTIVTDGPYRISRNPGYLGMALTYSGIALLSASWWAFATLVPTLLVVRFGVIAREERYLERKFGAEYLAYKRRVRRWV